jgi:hypothetical protein
MEIAPDAGSGVSISIYEKCHRDVTQEKTGSSVFFHFGWSQSLQISTEYPKLIRGAKQTTNKIPCLGSVSFPHQT